MYFLKRIFRKESTERRLDAELRFHLEQRTAEMVGQGMTPDEARRQANIEFGGLQGIKEECRESRRVHLVDTFLQDVRYGLRTMVRNPAFTIVAILTLAVGIGANTAIFSVVDGVLLSPLPFPHPERLVILRERKPHFDQGSVPYADFLDWKSGNHTFQSMGAYRGTGFIVTGAGVPEQVMAEMLSADIFPMLDIKPVLGRVYTAEEDNLGARPVIVISAGYWRRKFGSSPDVVGQHLTLDGRDYTIIGVAPENKTLFTGHDIFFPIGQWDRKEFRERGYGLGMGGIGRLKADVTLDQAKADLEKISRQLEIAYPTTNTGTAANLFLLGERLVGGVRPFLLMLMAAVLLVLLIACVNVSNLLLVRSTARQREFAIRISLGAQRSRMVRQLLTESLMLALIGGLLGLGLAAWGTGAALKLIPENLPRAGEVGMDWRVLLFTLAACILAGGVFGLAPALKSSCAGVHPSLKEAGRGSSGSHRMTSAFVAIEMALALMLLVGAGLLLRSMMALWRVDPGFNPHNVIGYSMVAPALMNGGNAESVRAALKEFDREARAVPGVSAVSLSWGSLPMSGDSENQFWIEGHPKPANDNEMNWSLEYVIEPDYFRLMGITLLQGRVLTEADNEHAQRVVVVDEKLVRQYFPQGDAIGKFLNINGRGDPFQIVGIVKHVNQWGLDSDAKESMQAQMYLSYMQLPDSLMVLANRGTSVVMRTDGPANGVFDRVQHAVARGALQCAVFSPQTFDEIIALTIAERRFAMVLLILFAGIAVLLAAIGLYGVVSYAAGQRTREIGIRMALGATRLHVLRMVMRQGGSMALVGLVAGLAASLALTRLMRALLFSVTPTDAVTFASVSALLAGVALLACFLPARRATAVNPVVALREE